MKAVNVRLANLVGAIAANVYMLLIIAVFISRILGWIKVEHWVGFASSLIIVPLFYLFVVGLRTGQRKMYFVWLALMVLFALFELVVDQILRIDLRSAKWTVVPYVMFFFAATGGMIGVASQAGKAWTITSVIIFLIMAIMAFVQRGITSM